MVLITNIWNESRFTASEKIWHKQLLFMAFLKDSQHIWHYLIFSRMRPNDVKKKSWWICLPYQFYLQSHPGSWQMSQHSKKWTWKDYSALLTWEWKINIDLVGKKPRETYIICEGVSSRKQCCFVCQADPMWLCEEGCQWAEAFFRAPSLTHTIIIYIKWVILLR